MDDDVPPEELREADRLAQLLGLSGLKSGAVPESVDRRVDVDDVLPNA